MKTHRTALADAPVQAWRNGGGSTRELLAWPQAQAWQLRVSVAQIAQSGPFSCFPGVDRCFAVLGGAGVVLHLKSGPQRVLPHSPGLSFAGEEAPQCDLLNGSSQDLNLMVRRGLGNARLWRADGDATLPGGARWRGVFTAAGELFWRDDADAEPWTLPGPGWCMEVR